MQNGRPTAQKGVRLRRLRRLRRPHRLAPRAAFYPGPKFNDEQQNEAKLQLNFKQNCAARIDKIIIFDNSAKKVGIFLNLQLGMINYNRQPGRGGRAV